MEHNQPSQSQSEPQNTGGPIVPGIIITVMGLLILGCLFFYEQIKEAL
jgi:hypothetical protein